MRKVAGWLWLSLSHWVLVRRQDKTRQDNPHTPARPLQTQTGASWLQRAGTTGPRGGPPVRLVRLTVLMRDVLSDVDTAPLQQLGLSQYVLLVFPGSKADNTRFGSSHFRSRVYPLHLQDRGDIADITNLSQWLTWRNEISREIFKCSFKIPFIRVSRISRQKSGSAAMSFYKYK